MQSTQMLHVQSCQVQSAISEYSTKQTAYTHWFRFRHVVAPWKSSAVEHTTPLNTKVTDSYPWSYFTVHCMPPFTHQCWGRLAQCINPQGGAS